ncbi:polypeptide N-acetylgalactosaminyltransferase 13 [Folsomia candida]|nr:polypeptide N-acetylgalactosaminyltransferase 13 [Folsomia candida]
MLTNVCNYFVRRRRRLFFVLSTFSLCLIIFILWSRQRPSYSNGGGVDGADKSDDYNSNRIVFPGRFGYQEADHLALQHDAEAVVDTSTGDDHPGTISAQILSLRVQARKENRDEFLVPVLRDFEFSEVDLLPIRLVLHNDYDEEIKDDLSRVKVGLGERGEKAAVPSYQEDVAKEIMKKEAFNRLLSEMISPNRSTPDTREPACKEEVYPHSLPDMSIVIIFTNEAFTSLVRTLHSVINRTPSHLLKEIIMVDDYSDHRDLKGKLERYIATKFPIAKIRLVRLAKRSGLIRARMIGAHLAIGKVLLFLDAHCEAIEGWAEPLLARIKEDRKAVVCPIIDVIDDKTMEYYHGNGEFFQIGGFTWSGHFTWINIPNYEAERKKHHHSPTRSPTMAGGLFAIERSYFWEVGSYDSDMQLWGGENLEMSFRIWQCGGSVEIVPCSRVGHIFRNFHPYSFPNNVDSHGLNTARLAEVWMDEYKELFYNHRQELKHAKYGDVTKRHDFRKRLKCKSFKWFLDHIYKEKFQMMFGSSDYGQVKNEKTNQCFDNMQHSESEEYELALYPCHSKLYPSQTFMLSNKGELRREAECASATGTKVQMVQCDHLRSDDLWELRATGELVSQRSNKCLTVEREGDKYVPTLAKCSGGSEQKWSFDKYDTHFIPGVENDNDDDPT